MILLALLPIHRLVINYQEKNNPVFEAVDFNPSFKNQLYFVYLGKKQDSKKGIAQYRANGAISNSKIQKNIPRYPPNLSTSVDYMILKIF